MRECVRARVSSAGHNTALKYFKIRMKVVLGVVFVLSNFYTYTCYGLLSSVELYRSKVVLYGYRLCVGTLFATFSTYK